jgi:alpha-amylase
VTKLKSLKILLLALLLCLLPLASAVGFSAGYEIFTGSYCDSNSDGIGDLNGILSKLDYIEALGVDGIWLTPVSPSPSYHKYNVADYTAIDPKFGTLADYDALAEACAARGITLIFDLVINHTSSEHPWFLSAVNSLQRGDGLNPYIGYYQFTEGTGDYPVEGTDWYYAAGFGQSMPELNLDNPAVRDEIRAIVAFWLGHGVGGFRLDAVTHYFDGQPESNAAFLEWLDRTVKTIDPEAFIVGEAWTDGNSILELYKSGIDGLFNFPMSSTGTLTNAMRGEGGQVFSQRTVQWQQDIAAINEEAVAVPFLGNHDQGRIAGVLVGDVQQEKQAAALYLLSPGVPFLYYGEEIGMTGSGDDPNKRLPMLWSASDPAGMCQPPEGVTQAQRLKVGVDGQEGDPNSLLKFYRAVLAFRLQHPVFVHGSAALIETADARLSAFTMTDGTETLLIAHNFSHDAALLMLSDGALLTIFDTGVTRSTQGNGGVLLAPRSTAVWALP